MAAENQAMSGVELSQAPNKISREAGPLGSVCMLTSAHSAIDVRIFEKEARSLANAGYDVTIVAPNDCDEDIGAVRIRGVARPRNRPERMSGTLWSLYRKALAVRADVYHFHDPDLIPVGLLLKAAGKRVVYDVHEDVPRDIMVKEWIASPVRQAVAAGAEAAHFVSALAFDGIIAATPTIAARFPRRRPTVIQNYPRLEGSAPASGRPYASRSNTAVYAGLINELRGAREMAAAIAAVPADFAARLVLAGRCDPPELAKELGFGSVNDRLDYRGWVTYEGMPSLLREARVGLVVLHPSQAFVECRPLKLFEYMAAGLPVIASDFPGWREIVLKVNCGLLVDPMDSEAISEALLWIFNHSAEAEEMGQRGLAAVHTKYNWQSQERTLLEFYEHVIGAESRSRRNEAARS